jgi:hypothetical protein
MASTQHAASCLCLQEAVEVEAQQELAQEGRALVARKHVAAKRLVHHGHLAPEVRGELARGPRPNGLGCKAAIISLARAGHTSHRFGPGHLIAHAVCLSVCLRACLPVCPIVSWLVRQCVAYAKWQQSVAANASLTQGAGLEAHLQQPAEASARRKDGCQQSVELAQVQKCLGHLWRPPIGRLISYIAHSPKEGDD